jgi:hypothetical protein
MAVNGIKERKRIRLYCLLIGLEDTEERDFSYFKDYAHHWLRRVVAGRESNGDTYCRFAYVAG